MTLSAETLLFWSLQLTRRGYKLPLAEYVPQSFDLTYGRKSSLQPIPEPSFIKVHNAVLTPIGEIPWGPPFYSLTVNSHVVRDRIFGADLAWSDDLRFLAVQEWLTTDRDNGPITRAAIIDTLDMRIAVLKVADRGFATGFQFRDGVFFYTKNFVGKAIEFEVVFASISNWKPLMESTS